MNPFEGQQRLDVRAEQVVWHLVSAGVAGFLLILMLFSVALLDAEEAKPEGEARPPTVARPQSDAAPAPAVLDTSMQEVPAGTGGRWFGVPRWTDRV